MLVLLAAGRTRRSIAAAMYVSAASIAIAIRKMCEQFEVTTTTALVARAYSLGVIQVGVWPPEISPNGRSGHASGPDAILKRGLGGVTGFIVESP